MVEHPVELKPDIDEPDIDELDIDEPDIVQPPEPVYETFLLLTFFHFHTMGTYLPKLTLISDCTISFIVNQNRGYIFGFLNF
jgi:hypothetical protein